MVYINVFPTFPIKRPTIMKLDVYVNYKENCLEAFQFYEQHLGGKITSVQTFARMPGTPDERRDKILHARMELGGATLMGADIVNAEPMRSAYLTLRLDTPEQTERIYALLTDGGQVFMQMAETFFAKRFAMLRDRFGTSWMLLCEEPGNG